MCLFHVNTVKDIEDGSDDDEKPPPRSTKKENPIVAELREVKIQLKEVVKNEAELKNELNQLKKQQENNSRHNSRNNSRGRYRKCDACEQNNRRRCAHCWKCGWNDHKISDCPEN